MYVQDADIYNECVCLSCVLRTMAVEMSISGVVGVDDVHAA